MNWIIERDKDGDPIRLVWSPEADLYIAHKNAERAAAEARNALPMPSMRQWARDRGLTP